MKKKEFLAGNILFQWCFIEKKKLNVLNYFCFRSYRTTLLNCISDKEYVCKLYCIREAFNHLFKNDNNVIWLADCGRRILTDIFFFAEKVIFQISLFY